MHFPDCGNQLVSRHPFKDADLSARTKRTINTIVGSPTSRLFVDPMFLYLCADVYRPSYREDEAHPDGNHDGMPYDSYPAQHESCLTSLVKVCAANLIPSTMVR